MTRKEMQEELFNIYCKHRHEWWLWENASEMLGVTDKNLADRMATKEFDKANAIEEVAETLFPHSNFYGMWLDVLE